MSDAAPHDGIVIDREVACGYRRPAALQTTFARAAAQLCEVDGWTNPRSGRPELVADLALEGGGVKGIALVGGVLALDEAGYSFRGVAGTSAGAIVACLVAALSASGDQPMTRLLDYLRSMDFSKFMAWGGDPDFLERRGGRMGRMAKGAAALSRRMGLYPGHYLQEFLEPKLEELGATTFGALLLTRSEDPDLSIGEGHNYRLVVHVSDITRGQLVRLPWDYPAYGYDDRDAQSVVSAVRASMSIPFFFEPVTFTARPAEVTLPAPGGGLVSRRYQGGTVTWVDGGLLRNFPINAFERVDGRPPRWPTIGIKLSSLRTDFPETAACESSVGVGMHCLRTMMNEWDSYRVDASTAGRTVFVDNAGLKATDFDLDPARQDTLFLNGVAAATRFVIEMAAAKGVPRTPAQSRALRLGSQAARVGDSGAVPGAPPGAAPGTPAGAPEGAVSPGADRVDPVGPVGPA